MLKRINQIKSLKPKSFNLKSPWHVPVTEFINLIQIFHAFNNPEFKTQFPSYSHTFLTNKQRKHKTFKLSD